MSHNTTILYKMSTSTLHNSSKQLNKAYNTYVKCCPTVIAQPYTHINQQRHIHYIHRYSHFIPKQHSKCIKHLYHNNHNTTSILLRCMSNIITTDTTASEYSELITDLFDAIQDRLEDEDIEMNPKVDIQYNDGVLTLKYNNEYTWVLNQHRVTRQLWLSSPISGPAKYNYHRNTQQWLNERDGKSKLSELLSKEWTNVLGVNVDFTQQF